MSLSPTVAAPAAPTRPLLPGSPIQRELLDSFHRWLSKRHPKGFLAQLRHKPAAGAEFDVPASAFFYALVQYLDNNKPGRPKASLSNIAALVRYPDLAVVVEFLDANLPLSEQPWPTTIAPILDLLQQDLRPGYDTLAGLSGFLQEDPGRATGPMQRGMLAAGVRSCLEAFLASLAPVRRNEVETILPILHAWEQAKFSEPVDGDVWFTSVRTGRPVRALPPSASECNNNKIVLGPAGSGRSVLMGQLAQAAHQGNQQVVTLAFRQRRQALYHLTRNQGGVTHQLSTRSQATFNPFWFSWHGIHEKRRPNEAEMFYLTELLSTLLQLVCPAEAALSEDVREGTLIRLLYLYYQAEWEKSTRENDPNFNSFYEFATSEQAQMAVKWREDPQERTALLAWVRAAGESFYRGGRRELLLNASSQQMADLFTPRNGLLYVEPHIYDGELGDELTTQCSCFLLLFCVDTQIGTFIPERAGLTVLVDEFPGEAMQATGTRFLNAYLSKWSRYRRTLICSWHIDPEHLFIPELPGTRSLLAWTPYLLLLLTYRHPLPGLLRLTEQEAQKYAALKKNQLLLVGSDPHAEVYEIGLSREQLAAFQQAEAPTEQDQPAPVAPVPDLSVGPHEAIMPIFPIGSRLTEGPLPQTGLPWGWPDCSFLEQGHVMLLQENRFPLVLSSYVGEAGSQGQAVVLYDGTQFASLAAMAEAFTATYNQVRPEPGKATLLHPNGNLTTVAPFPWLRNNFDKFLPEDIGRAILCGPQEMLIHAVQAGPFAGFSLAYAADRGLLELLKPGQAPPRYPLNPVASAIWLQLFGPNDTGADGQAQRVQLLYGPVLLFYTRDFQASL